MFTQFVFYELVGLFIYFRILSSSAQKYKMYNT